MEHFFMIRSGPVHDAQIFTLTVAADNSPQRIDAYLASQFSHYSRSYFARLIDQNLIVLNNIPVKKQSLVVKPHDTVIITFPALIPESESTDTAARNLGITIIDTHEHFLIVAKPANVITHKPSLTSSSVTLADWLVATHSVEQSVGAQERPGIVHRLDKDTSGLLVIARTNYAHIQFGAMFKDRTIKKTYHAIVHGHPPASGVITHAIGRNPYTRNKMTTVIDHSISLDVPHSISGFRAAKTEYRVLEYFDTCSLIEVKPLTGRTHQIRVHCAAIGHPIVGDALYGKQSSLIGRQALHAYALSFTFDGIPYDFKNEPPHDFADLLANLRKK
jgi:23S rRNA pseudouridine1911/1915/1917 synthase